MIGSPEAAAGAAEGGGAPPAVRWPPLLAAVAVVEVLAGAGVLPVWPGLSHEVALPPLDLVSDFGVVAARATSAPWFAVGIVAALAGRAALLALMLGWSRSRLRQTATFYLIAALPAYAAAALVNASQVSLYALLFWGGLVVAVIAALVLAPVPWRGRGVWQGLIAGVAEGARIPTLVGYLVMLAALGGLVRVGGTAAALVGVPVSAGLTLAAARRLGATGARALPYRLGALGLVATALVAALLVPSHPAPATAVPAAGPGSLLLVPGIDTSSGHGTLFRLDPRTLGYDCTRTYYFSYAGAGRGAARGEAACPIRTGAPYTRADTERPLDALVAAFDAQVAGLPGPVTVVTHSSAGWVAWAALSGGSPATAAVRHLVLLTPLADPLGYPPPGRIGGNVVGAAGARAITGLARRIGFSTFRLDAPLASQLMGDPAALARLLDRPLSTGLGALAVPAAYDLPLLVGRRLPLPGATMSCPSPAGHSALVTDRSTATLVDGFLAGRAQPACRPWETWQGVVAAGFRAPD